MRHRATGISRVAVDGLPLEAPGLDAATTQETIDRDSLARDAWEPVWSVPYQFNRLVLFRPWLIHRPGTAFGSDVETGRLVHVFFFLTPGRYGRLRSGTAGTGRVTR